jgi:uncharacterized membrane protein
MRNKLKNLYYSIVESKAFKVRLISTFVFVVLFLLICALFELFARGITADQTNKLIHEILFFGI